MVPMMTHWLLRIALSLVLLVVTMLLLLLPARHVLMPLWPWQVDELLVARASSDTARRDFVTVQPGEGVPNGVISRDRPIMLVAIERPGDEVIHGFLVGVRPEPDAGLLDKIPSWLLERRLISPEPSNLVVVVMRADESRTELSLGQIHRMYRPNQLSLLERALLTGQRLVEAWRARGWLPVRAGEQEGSERDQSMDVFTTGHHQQQALQAQGHPGTFG